MLNNEERVLRSKMLCKEGEGGAICHLVVEPCLFRKLEVKDIPNKMSIYLSQNGGIPQGKFRSFKTDDSLRYDAFCNDFGPMNAHDIISFVEMMDQEVTICKSKGISAIVYCALPGRRHFTNASFLLGAYMMLRLKTTSVEVISRFQAIRPSCFEAYCDASCESSNFGLELGECWQALEKAQCLGWIGTPTAKNSQVWGMIDKEMYAHYDNIFNAHLHTVVPGKLVAFLSPKDLGGKEHQDEIVGGKFITRVFSPLYYLDIFSELDISTVICLDQSDYDRDIFLNSNFQHHDLPFGSSITPTAKTVSEFLHIVDTSKGVVAVHGQCGYDLTGVMAALYIMRTHAFTAKEATAWVRIMRPGCVVGNQQPYLMQVEASVLEIMDNIKKSSSRPLSAATALAPHRPTADMRPGQDWHHRRGSFAGVGTRTLTPQGEHADGAMVPAGQRLASISGGGSLRLPRTATTPGTNLNSSFTGKHDSDGVLNAVTLTAGPQMPRHTAAAAAAAAIAPPSHRPQRRQSLATPVPQISESGFDLDAWISTGSDRKPAGGVSRNLKDAPLRAIPSRRAGVLPAGLLA